MLLLLLLARARRLLRPPRRPGQGRRGSLRIEVPPQTRVADWLASNGLQSCVAVLAELVRHRHPHPFAAFSPCHNLFCRINVAAEKLGRAVCRGTTRT